MFYVGFLVYSISLSLCVRARAKQQLCGLRVFERVYFYPFYLLIYLMSSSDLLDFHVTAQEISHYFL